MQQHLTIFSIFCLIFLNKLIVGITLNDNPLLLLISFDGFRYDLLNSTLVPHIWKFASEGVNFINGITSQFPSLTIPNHATIATGLTVETHGLVANRFYDRERQLMYDIMNLSHTPDIVEPSLSSRYYNGEPIWLTNERSGENRRSASVEWPGGDAPYPNFPQKPKYIKPYQEPGNLTQWKANFDYILRLFTSDNQPVNFVAWYVGEPDSTLHENGFYNGRLVRTLKHLDVLFEYIISKLHGIPDLSKRLNIILVSDHGHAEVNGRDSVFCLSDYIELEKIHYGDHMVYVDDLKQKEKIYQVLKKAVNETKLNIEIYKREEVPTRYHYSKNKYIGDIVLVPRVGTVIQNICRKEAAGKTFASATHGVDPAHWTMRSILLMNGPVFKKRTKVETIPNNIGIYSLMCYVLGVLEAPNNGSFKDFIPALAYPSQEFVRLKASETKLLTIVLTVIVPSLCLISLCIIWILQWGNGKSKTNTNEYRSISQNPYSENYKMENNSQCIPEAILITTSSEDEL